MARVVAPSRALNRARCMCVCLMKCSLLRVSPGALNPDRGGKPGARLVSDTPDSPGSRRQRRLPERPGAGERSVWRPPRRRLVDVGPSCAVARRGPRYTHRTPKPSLVPTEPRKAPQKVAPTPEQIAQVATAKLKSPPGLPDKAKLALRVVLPRAVIERLMARAHREGIRH